MYYLKRLLLFEAIILKTKIERSVNQIFNLRCRAHARVSFLMISSLLYVCMYAAGHLKFLIK